MTPELQDDELLRGYLLGKLPDEEADRLERRLLADDELFELAEAVELDLLAAVDFAERQEVLRKLAASPRGQERLAFARSLNVLAREKAEKSNVLRFPAFHPSAIRWLALAASLVMVAGLGWFAWQHRAQAPDVTSRVAVQTPTPTPQPPAPVTSPTLPEAKTAESIPERPAVREKPAVTTTAVWTLSFVTSRGAEERQQFEAGPDIRRVEIQIDAEGLEPARSFDVVVRNSEREVLLEKKGLAIGGLVLDIPAKKFSSGRYEVAITPQGGEEISQEFEVVEGKR